VAHTYQAVGWNRQKRIYDRTLLLGVALFLGAFVAGNLALHPNLTIETGLIRGLGVTAIVLLHVILAIGPLCRLDARFLPLLYNRRHMGVTMFLLALAHGAFAIVQYHALGELNPLVSLFVSNPHYGSLVDFPFEVLGVGALAILFLMAATSHDFWLANLTAPTWKALHMLVYGAYGLLVMHVVLGALQVERSPVNVALLGAGLVVLVGLHLLAALSGASLDRPRDGSAESSSDGFVDVCGVHEISEGRAHIACLAGDRVAIFKYDGLLSAVSNACQHQNGPLGEGRVIDGCITCPWHGYQYRPEDGRSPAPFTEKVPTFDVRVANGRVLVNPVPHPAGTRVEPAPIDGGGT
jgi:nitrite reductase/ring-hydroxylating ferredoxin subunit/DMSO/TMAO reductase YedYZ heme-binding membrane subunit